MISEVLVLADPYITLPSASGEGVRMSACPHDLSAYWRMGEYLLKVIENSSGSEMKPARDLIHRIRVRDLFPFVGEVLIYAINHFLIVLSFNISHYMRLFS
jgi:hypothetical protein